VDNHEGETPWWNHVGFVFGYRSPVEDTGDEAKQFEFLLVKWSGTLGVPPTDGFYLVRVNGIFDKDYERLARHEDSTACKLLGQNRDIEGAGTKGVEHAFELVYEKDRVQITVDGKPLFDVKGEFVPGRFGFYNFGTANVHY
jgi:hypothetical protein